MKPQRIFYRIFIRKILIHDTLCAIPGRSTIAVLAIDGRSSSFPAEYPATSKRENIALYAALRLKTKIRRLRYA